MTMPAASGYAAARATAETLAVIVLSRLPLLQQRLAVRASVRWWCHGHRLLLAGVCGVLGLYSAA